MEQWGAIFQPYETGINRRSWMNGQTIDEITVTEETHYYMTTGCESIGQAGTTCTLVWTLHDQYGNILDLVDGGGITWNGRRMFTESTEHTLQQPLVHTTLQCNLHKALVTLYQLL